MHALKASRAEGDLIVAPTGAGELGVVIIIRIAKRVRAQALKELRIGGRLAAGAARAAVLRSVEDGAWVIAAAGHFECAGALPNDVGSALDVYAAVGRGGAEVHGHVESLNEGDVDEVEVLVLVEGEFGEGVGWGAVGGAGEFAAVAALAVPVAVAIEGAASTAPDAGSGGAGVDGDRPGLTLVELLAAAVVAEVCPCGPHGVGTLVDDVEGGGVGEGEEEEGEEEESEGSRGGHFDSQEEGFLVEGGLCGAVGWAIRLFIERWRRVG